jgi:hypothetical protein
MTIEANVLSSNLAGIAKKPWVAPRIHVLDMNAAAGASVGPLCDKYGSLSASMGNDHCDPSTKS